MKRILSDDLAQTQELFHVAALHLEPMPHLFNGLLARRRASVVVVCMEDEDHEHGDACAGLVLRKEDE
jgi:hypothetical protein